MGEVVVSSEERMEVELGAEAETEKDEKRTTETENKDGSLEEVSWQRFLPTMVLRVLLVEADDSTRHIIAALLRKCSYRVAAVADGLMAWETLKGRPHNIDLILTEVELPSISGYALLTLVMEHDICKNIPVIMMSSHDSISMVLKCMLKGAADFLIKPVRKNELRNLWQHVWRRHTLTAGHISQNSPTAQHKVEVSSENDSANNHSSDCATSSQKNEEYSERGSDTQGPSMLKVGSASNLSNAGGENYGERAKLGGKSVTPENIIAEKSSSIIPEDPPCNETYYPTALRLGAGCACDKTVVRDECARQEIHGVIANIPHGERSTGAIDLIGAFDNGPNHTYEHSSLNDGTSSIKFNPRLELSRRGFYPSNSKNQGVDERHALNHSNASAFSWYNGKTLQPFFPTSTGNCAEFKEDASKSLELSSNQLSQNPSGGSQQHGASVIGIQEITTTLVIGQSTQAELARPSPKLGMISVSGVRLDSVCNGYGRIFPTVYHTQSGLPPARSPRLAGQREQSPFPTSTSVHSNAEIHDSEQNYRSDEAANNSIDQNAHQQIQHSTAETVEEVRDGSSAAGQNNSNGAENHNNSSTHGSVHSRNDRNVTLAVASEKAMPPDGLKNGGFGIHDGLTRMDSHPSSQREAALRKFRLKRKDRCYEKKVRYQSRKMLAERRPRVKGQFVRQAQNAPMVDANS